ncbi:MAG: DUF4105 domain-containing protein [Spirochaetes bacterium]|nr:DUF4105 domain-containing protein [Spirochaetota bacterium]
MPDKFFLSAAGITDPEAELDATLMALLTDIESAEPARCRFPAREIFLAQALAFDTARLPPVKCPKYDDWVKHMAADGVSIVFASFFMGNPSSMFGHTFLRFHNTHGNALLDAAFNYAANTGEENAIVYAWRGMTGGFPGTYAMHPYYVKINEYNDMESRDLWEYRLAVSADELKFLQAHLWEMSFAYFPYYYLDENCSYQLLTLLETMRPSLRLTNRFALFVTPTDTLHTLAEAGLITDKIEYRASVYTRYVTFYENASRSARQLFDSLKTSRALPEANSTDAVVAVDLLLELYKYQNDYDMAKWASVDLAHYQKLLAWRAAAPQDSGLEAFVKADPAQNPLAGFKSTQISLGAYSAQGLGNAVQIGIRPALRELQDVSRGFSPWSQMQMMSFSFSYLTDKNLLRLEEFTFADIYALAPWRAEIKKFSYRLRSGLYRNDVFQNLGPSTLTWDSSAAGGITLLPFSWLGTFLLAQATTSVGSIWEHSLRIAPALVAGFKFNWSSTFASVVSYEIDYGLVSAPASWQKIDCRTVLGVFQNWAIEFDALYVTVNANPTLQDFAKASLLVKTYF